MNRNYSRLMVMFATFAIAGVVSWIYAPGLEGEFVFDDNPAVVENESIRQLTPLWGSSDSGGPVVPQKNTPLTARPLVNLTFAINYHFGLLNPVGYRATQLVMHWLATLLLWRLGCEVLRHPAMGDRFKGWEPAVAFLGALLWAVHPLNTETVNYVTQRTELMMAVFYFACLLSCLRYTVASTSWRRAFWLAMVWLTSWCGILCKETMATIPAVVVLGQWMLMPTVANNATTVSRLSVFVRHAFRSSWLLYATLASCWLPIAAIYGSGFVTPGGGFGKSIGAVAWWWTQCEAVFLYLRLSVWPWPLLVHYDFPIHERLADAWPFVFGVLVWCVFAVYQAWRSRWVGFVMLVFLIVLSPTLLIPLPGETVAERRMYVPLSVMAMWVSAALFVFLRRCADTVGGAIGGRHGVLVPWAGVLAVPLVAFTLVSHKRIPAYRTQFSLWHDNMVHHPTDHLSWMNVGAMLAEAGQTRLGLPYLERAVELNPDYERSRFNLARGYEAVGQIDDAVTHYRVAIQLDPSDHASTYNLARLCEQRGEVDEAIRLYTMVCNGQPDFLEAHVNLGVLLVSMPRPTKARLREAIQHFQVATELDGSDDNYINLMLAYQMNGDHKQAIKAGNQGVQAALMEDDVATAAALQRALGSLSVVAAE